MRLQLTCDLATSPSTGSGSPDPSFPQFQWHNTHVTGSGIQNGTTRYPISSQSEATAENPQRGSATEDSFKPTLSDLELLHQYSTVTSLQLGSTWESQQIFQNYMPRLGLSHLFVLRGVLAFAALHLAYLNPPQRAYYRDQAIAHHVIGVHEFQNALKTLNETNQDVLEAAFLSASLLILCNFAFQILDPDTSSGDAINGIFNWVFLVRGFRAAIMDPFDKALHDGKLRALLAERPQPIFLNGELTPELRSLATAFATPVNGRDAVAAHAYGHAIQELAIAFARIREKTSRGEQGDIGAILLWPTTVSQDFVNLLRLQTPEALVILAHYATVLRRKGMFFPGLAVYAGF